MKRPPHLPLAAQLRQRRGATAELYAVAPGNARARHVRRILGSAIRSHIRQQGDDIAGFALVTWDMRGGACGAYLTDVGPVATTLLPTYVHDVLNRHVAVELAVGTEVVTGDEA